MSIMKYLLLKEKKNNTKVKSIKTKLLPNLLLREEKKIHRLKLNLYRKIKVEKNKPKDLKMKHSSIVTKIMKKFLKIVKENTNT